jgi:uncharacterized protein with HEPN domain
MRGKLGDRARLNHILDSIVEIETYLFNVDFETFLENSMMRFACIKQMEIIGEATKKIPADFKVKWNTIQWKNMAGMRDRLIHDYIGVNYAIVWDVMKNKIPDMHKKISEFLDKD